MKNRKFVISLMLLLCLFMQFPCAAKEKVRLNHTKLILKVGQIKKMKLKNAKKVKWSSTNKRIAKVDKKGRITAEKVGNVVITAKSGRKRYRCKVKVTMNTRTYKSHQLVVNNGIFTLKTYKKIRSIILYDAGGSPMYTVTSPNGIYHIFSLLSERKLMQNGEMFDGGRSICLKCFDGKSYKFTIGKDLIVGGKVYSMDKQVVNSVVSMIKKYNNQ